MQNESLKLLNPTDDELNAAFATHVVGMTDVRREEGEDVDIESRSICSWAELRGTVDGERFFVPDYCQSFDAVLPWLGTVDWDAGTIVGFKILFTAWRDRLEFCHEDKSLPRAAVIALLSAHGVEVVA